MLNGTSSSGKSTLMRALQARLDGAWLGVGIDTVVFALPSDTSTSPSGRGVPVRRRGAEADAPFLIETGELGERLVSGCIE